MKKIAKKYNFDIDRTSNQNDYSDLKLIKKLKDKQFLKSEINNIKEYYDKKSNDLYLIYSDYYKSNIIVDSKTNKLAYILKHDNVIPFNNYKLNNQDLINILIQSERSGELYNLIIDRYIGNENTIMRCMKIITIPDKVFEILKNKIITDKNFIYNFFYSFQKTNQYGSCSLRIPCKLIGENIITDKKIIEDFIKYCFEERLQNGGIGAIRYFIKNGILTEDEKINYFVQILKKESAIHDLATIFQQVKDKKERLDIIELVCCKSELGERLELLIANEKITNKQEIDFILQNIALYSDVTQSYLYKQIVSGKFKDKEIVTNLASYILDLHSGKDKTKALYEILNQQIITDEDLLWKIVDWFNENNSFSDIDYLIEHNKLDKKFLYQK